MDLCPRGDIDKEFGEVCCNGKKAPLRLCDFLCWRPCDRGDGGEVLTIGDATISPQSSSFSDVGGRVDGIEAVIGFEGRRLLADPVWLAFIGTKMAEAGCGSINFECRGGGFGFSLIGMVPFNKELGGCSVGPALQMRFGTGDMGSTLWLLDLLALSAEFCLLAVVGADGEPLLGLETSFKRPFGHSLGISGE